MIVVCDCSPLIALALCDKLDLLDLLFSEIVIPETVYNESTITGKHEAEKIGKWAQGKVVSAVNMSIPQIIDLHLGKGESEAIALYWEKEADYLLVDEQKGRHVASSKGIKIIGTLGILLLAKQRGYISTIGPFLNILKNSNVRFSEELYQKILKLAKETG
jgi:predicted nucleic acid-binding protein